MTRPSQDLDDTVHQKTRLRLLAVLGRYAAPILPT
jgi:hypothetical protein